MRTRLLSVLVIAAIGIASTGFTTTHYQCIGRKACERTCHAAQPASCCKVITDRHIVETNAKALEPSDPGLTQIAVCFPPQSELVPKNPGLPLVPGHPLSPPFGIAQEQIVLRI